MGFVQAERFPEKPLSSITMHSPDRKFTRHRNPQPVTTQIIAAYKNCHQLVFVLRAEAVHNTEFLEITQTLVSGQSVTPVTQDF